MKNIKTTQPDFSIIVGLDQDGGFAKDGKIPWNCSEDLKKFKEITTGNICIMGRRTYEDMFEMMKARNIDVGNIENILPNRTSFVLSSNPNFEAPGATVVPNIRKAWQSLTEEDTREIFILGGYHVFIEALAFTTKIYANIMRKTYDCDKFFPIDIINKDYIVATGEQLEELDHLVYHKRPPITFRHRPF